MNENEDTNKIVEGIPLIGEGRTLKNGGQQFYESLVRQQKVIVDLIKDKKSSIPKSP